MAATVGTAVITAGMGDGAMAARIIGPPITVEVIADRMDIAPLPTIRAMVAVRTSTAVAIRVVAATAVVIRGAISAAAPIAGVSSWKGA
jgi:hypothetical protein